MSRTSYTTSARLTVARVVAASAIALLPITAAAVPAVAQPGLPVLPEQVITEAEQGELIHGRPRYGGWRNSYPGWQNSYPDWRGRGGWGYYGGWRGPGFGYWPGLSTGSA